MQKMEAETGEVKNRRKKRVRTKGLQKKLLEQIEFYFGDANLQKDRFLQQKMKEHPESYISVETIAGFNKMKNLTTDISMVVQVMKQSELVELSADEMWVRRSKPLPTITDTDDRTIYVEHLPPSCSQDSVRKLFKAFGNICYVSIPRHKQSGAVKGFSFVEFATVEEATAALEYFKSGTKPVTGSKPLPDKSGGSGEKGGEGEGEKEIEEREEENGEVQERGAVEGGGEMGEEGEGDGCENEREETEEGEAVEGDGDEGNGDKEAESSRRKRARDSAEGSPNATEDVTPVAKRSRGSDERDEDGKEVKETNKPAVTHAAVKATAEANEAVREGQGESLEAVQSRKRKREDEETGNEGQGSGETPDSKTVRLDPQASGNHRKSDGGGVKMVRLESQATETGDDESEGIKHQQKKGKKNRQHKKWDWEAALRNLQLRVMAKKEWLEMRELFRSMQKEKMKEMKQQLKEEGGKKADKAFVGQCLVKVEGVGVGEGEDVVTVEKVQEICSKYGGVAYTDIKKGASEGYIRYSVSGCVENLVNAETMSGVKFTAVAEEDERAYFLKTVATRKQLTKGQRAKKKRNIRGQDRIISRALQHQSHKSSKPSKPSSPVPESTHIRFSDSEHES